jgi:prepilin-type N-terminal cleavage/methylation domain-containing protein
MVTRTRSGLTLIEVALSVAVLGVVSTTVLQVIQWSAAQHRAAERKRCALETATALLDEFTLRDWSAITPENAAKMGLPVEAARELGNPHVILLVKDDEDQKAKKSGGGKGLRGKRVSVEITWANGTSPQGDRINLVTWVFPRKAEVGAKK